MQIKFLLSSIYSFLFFMSFVSFNGNNNGNGKSSNGVLAQEPVFELPVQLVGFPVIVLAVRFTNFVKKLGYSLNPQTYKTSSSASSASSALSASAAAASSSSSSSAKRTRRSTAFINDDDLPISEISREAIDVSIAEKRILTELGPKACVMEEPCKLHASRHGQIGEQPDWQDILRNYKVHSSGMKQWYLLSVFLGDVIRDISLCKQLAKRLQCGRDEKPFIRD